MRNFIAILLSQVYRLRRSLALWLALWIPLVNVSLQFVNYWQRGQALLPANQIAGMWFAQNVFIVWGVMMLPLYVGMTGVLLAGLEHQNGGWKHLHALPVPRWMHYLSLMLVHLVLVVLAGLATLALLWLAITILSVLRPDLGFELGADYGRMALFLARMTAAALLMVVVQGWISIRWASFTLPMGVSVGALFLSFLLSNTSLWRIYPWSQPPIALQGFLPGAGPPMALPLITGLVGGALALVAAVGTLAQREIL